MKQKIIKHLMRYLPRHIAELLADEILTLIKEEEDWECGVNWAGIDPEKYA